MGLIELSGLHTCDSQPAASSSMPLQSESTAAPFLTCTPEHQQAGQSCSTDSSPASRHDRSPSQASSVRSRAAFFEAMSVSPPGTFPYHDQGSPPASPTQSVSTRHIRMGPFHLANLCSSCSNCACLPGITLLQPPLCCRSNPSSKGL